MTKWQKVVVAVLILMTCGYAMLAESSAATPAGDSAARNTVVAANAVLDPGLGVVLCVGGLLILWKRGRGRNRRTISDE